MVFVEGATVFVHQRVLFPGFRDHHHRSLGKRIACHRQQLDTVVESCRVGLAFVHHRIELAQIVAQHGRLHHAFTGTQPVEVALHRVDFAVVGDHAVGVGERPFREGVRRETLVHQRQGGFAARIGEILVVHTDLSGEQQPLVDQGACGHRRHIVFLAVLETQLLDGVAGCLADYVELAFQCFGDHHVLAATDKDLADHRLLGLHAWRHRHLVIDRHIAPAQHHLAFAIHGTFEFLFAGLARGSFLGQEDHADSVFTGRR